jgi:hypothetical protein
LLDVCHNLYNLIRSAAALWSKLVSLMLRSEYNAK